MKKHIITIIFSLLCMQEKIAAVEVIDLSAEKDTHQPRLDIVRKKQKTKKVSIAQETVNAATQETPYEDAPISNFLAKIGEELGIEQFNAILANSADPRYANTFVQLEAWLNKNGYKS